MTQFKLYSNDNRIAVLVSEQWKFNIEISDFTNIPPEVSTVYVFDLSFYQTPDYQWTENELQEKDGETGKFIHRALAGGKDVCLFTYSWHEVTWRRDERNHLFFKFTRCDTPCLEKAAALIGFAELSFMMREAVRDLLRPIKEI